MRVAIALGMLCMALICGDGVAAQEQYAPQKWTIVVTITNRNTGERVEQHELDPELRFEDPTRCKSILSKVGSIPSGESLSVVLTCRKLKTTASAEAPADISRRER